MATKNSLRNIVQTTAYGKGQYGSAYGGWNPIDEDPAKSRIPVDEVRSTSTQPGVRQPYTPEQAGRLLDRPATLQQAGQEAGRQMSKVQGVNEAFRTEQGGAYRNLWGPGVSPQDAQQDRLRAQNTALHEKTVASTRNTLKTRGRTFTIAGRMDPAGDRVRRLEEEKSVLLERQRQEDLLNRPFKVGQVTTSSYTPPEGDAPELELPKYEAQKYDTRRVNQLRQRAASTAIRESRRGLQRAYARSFAAYGFNPLARGAAMRLAMEGHGLNVSRAMSSAEQSARNEYEQERRVDDENRMREHQRLTTTAMENYKRAVEKYQRSGTQSQTTKGIYGVRDTNQESGFRVLDQEGVTV